MAFNHGYLCGFFLLQVISFLIKQMAYVPRESKMYKCFIAKTFTMATTQMHRWNNDNDTLSNRVDVEMDLAPHHFANIH